MLQHLSLILGIMVLAVTWLGPLPEMARSAFFAHMTMHMAVVAVAAPLLSLGVAGTRLDPVPLAPRLFAPVPASILELVIVWAWHTPGLHHLARYVPGGLPVEQGLFLASGLWMWLSAFGGHRLEGSRSGAGVIGLLLTSMHMTLLGALLALSPRPLFYHPVEVATSATSAQAGPATLDLSDPEVAATLCLPPGLTARLSIGPVSTPPPVGGLNPLDDQHLGGAIMLLVGGATYLVGGLWLTLRLLDEREISAGEPA